MPTKKATQVSTEREAELTEMIRELARKIDEMRQMIATPRSASKEDEIGGVTAVARWCGWTVGKAKARVVRDRDLALLAMERPGSHREWSRSQVLALLESRVRRKSG